MTTNRAKVLFRTALHRALNLRLIPKAWFGNNPQSWVHDFLPSWPGIEPGSPEFREAILSSAEDAQHLGGALPRISYDATGEMILVTDRTSMKRVLILICTDGVQVRLDLDQQIVGQFDDVFHKANVDRRHNGNRARPIHASLDRALFKGHSDMRPIVLSRAELQTLETDVQTLEWSDITQSDSSMDILDDDPVFVSRRSASSTKPLEPDASTPRMVPNSDSSDDSEDDMVIDLTKQRSPPHSPPAPSTSSPPPSGGPPQTKASSSLSIDTEDDIKSAVTPFFEH